MAIITKAPPVSSAPVGAQISAEAARAEALKMFSSSTIDDSSAPVEEGDKPKVAAPAEEAPVEEKAAVEESEPEPEEEKAPEKAEDKKPEEKKLSDPLKNSFEKLAREKAEMRKTEEALKAREARVAKYEMLDRAVANDDVLGAVSLLGLKYSTLVKQAIAKGGDAQDDEPEESEVRSDPNEKRVAALENELREMRIAKANADMTSRVVAAAKEGAAKFPIISADPGLAKDVVEELIAFVKRTGNPPGETIEESIQMAMEAVEAKEEATKQKLMKRYGLTGVKASDSISPVAPKSAVDPAASELARKSRTLTNSHASAPRTVGSTSAETPEELRAQALALLEAQGE